jgi:hypothetical protein
MRVGARFDGDIGRAAGAVRPISVVPESDKRKALDGVHRHNYGRNPVHAALVHGIGMFHQRSLLSVPSICQFTELVRVPFDAR